MKTEQLALMDSTTTLAFVRPTTPVSADRIQCQYLGILLDCLFELVVFSVGEMCEEMEDVCAPGRSPCQHQSTCLITSNGPKLVRARH